MKTKDNELVSIRLRLSEQIAECIGEKYDKKRYAYGGFFSVYQLEKILKLLVEAKESTTLETTKVNKEPYAYRPGREKSLRP